MARRYGGLSAEQRVAERRTRLVAAGRELLAEAGWAGTSLRSVCARAGLADRYFYESFATREALLLTVCEEVGADVVALTARRLGEAGKTYDAQVRAAASAVLELLQSEAGLARVLLLETPDSPVLDAQRRRMRAALVDLLVAMTADLEELSGVSEVQRRLGAHAILGALFELLTAWLADEVEVSREDLLDFVVHVSAAVALPTRDAQPHAWR